VVPDHGVGDPDATQEYDTEQLLGLKTQPRETRRKIGGRLALLALTAICLYLLFPSLVQVFASVDQLSRIQPLWFPLILGLQVGSFTCVWGLQRLALQTDRWFPVATSQLAGNAFSRIVPGGAAAGVAMQYKMLAEAGVSTA